MKTFPNLFRKSILILPVILFFTKFSYGQGPGFWTSVGQKIDISEHRGKKFKLEAAAKLDSEFEEAQIQLWARIDNEDQSQGFFDNMQDRPIKSREWEVFTIEGEIGEEADSLAFGGMAFYNGRFFFDDFKISVSNEASWDPLELQNPSFEEGDIQSHTVPNWAGGILVEGDFVALPEYKNAYEGDISLCIDGKNYVHAPPLLKNFVGKWHVEYIPDSSRNVEKNYKEVGEWIFESLMGGYGLKGTYLVLESNSGAEGHKNIQVISYHPAEKKLHQVIFLNESPPIRYTGKLDTASNLTLQEILPPEFTENATKTFKFTWINENELVCKYVDEYLFPNFNRIDIRYYRMKKK